MIRYYSLMNYKRVRGRTFMVYLDAVTISQEMFDIHAGMIDPRHL